jgi:hypothetical protein
MKKFFLKVVAWIFVLGSAPIWGSAEGNIIVNPGIHIPTILIGTLSAFMYFLGFSMLGAPNMGLLAGLWDVAAFVGALALVSGFKFTGEIVVLLLLAGALIFVLSIVVDKLYMAAGIA